MASGATFCDGLVVIDFVIVIIIPKVVAPDKLIGRVFCHNA